METHQIYTNPRLNKVASKWKKFAERGVSNLYLIKELDDDGVACACYAYSIKDGIIDEEMLERIREICAQSLSSDEMRADGSFCKPDEWWGFKSKALNQSGRVRQCRQPKAAPRCRAISTGNSY